MEKDLAKTTFAKEFVDGELVTGDARQISEGDIRGEFIDADAAGSRLDVMAKDKRVSTSNSVDELDVFKLENGLVGLIVHDAVRAWNRPPDRVSETVVVTHQKRLNHVHNPPEKLAMRTARKLRLLVFWFGRSVIFYWLVCHHAVWIWELGVHGC